MRHDNPIGLGWLVRGGVMGERVSESVLYCTSIEGESVLVEGELSPQSSHAKPKRQFAAANSGDRGA